MGRSFKNEIALLPKTLEWSFKELEISHAETVIKKIKNKNLIVVGSGGSYSAASYISKLHETSTGLLSKALTPLEFTFIDHSIKNSAVLFLSSSGNNKDILDSYKSSISKIYNPKLVYCLNENGKLVKTLGEKTNTLCIAYSNPIGKDGFLAVNSLIAMCIIAARAYGFVKNPKSICQKLINITNKIEDNKWHQVLTKSTILTIGGGWSTPVIIDFESKFSEAALGSVLLSDFRNFGHGRHNWIDKKSELSGVFAFETPQSKDISVKTLKYLPSKIPVSRIKTDFEGPIGSIDLFLSLFHIVSKAGEILDIDPGRPKVPDFGRKLFRIGIPIKKSANLSELTEKIWLERKSICTNSNSVDLKSFLQAFIDNLLKTKFRAILFDYDGTLISEEQRFTQPNSEISHYLNCLLRNNIIVGIATGRGKSVQNSLRSCIDKENWNKIYIGNYNCSFVIPLSSDIPKNYKKPIKSIEILNKSLLKNAYISKQIVELRRKQISITPNSNIDLDSLLNIVKEELANISYIKVFQSDHSVDIIHKSVSKINLLKKFSNDYSLETNDILKIGDQGNLSGNDYEMLSEPLSISVNKVSSSLNTCWNISPIGAENSIATEAILNSFEIMPNHFSINKKLLLSGAV